MPGTRERLVGLVHRYLERLGRKPTSPGALDRDVDDATFVNFFGPKDGLVHISQLSGERVSKTTDVVKEGDKVFVKLMGFDERGKVRLSMKVVDQKTGKEIVREKKREEGEETAA